MLPSGVRCCRIFVVASAAASVGSAPDNDEEGEGGEMSA